MARSQPCTTTSLTATVPATSPGMSSPPALVIPAQAASSCQAPASSASRSGMRVRQPAASCSPFADGPWSPGTLPAASVKARHRPST